MHFEKDKFYKYTPSHNKYYYLGMGCDSSHFIVFCQISTGKINMKYKEKVFISDVSRKKSCKLISKKEVLEEIRDPQLILRNDVKNILLKLDVSEQIDDIINKLEKYDKMG